MAIILSRFFDLRPINDDFSAKNDNFMSLYTLINFEVGDITMNREFMSIFKSAAQIDFEKYSELTDAEFMQELEKEGYEFNERFQVKDCFIHRKVAGNDVLISVGSNIANFNGYIELNSTAAALWDEMKEPKTCKELETYLEKTYDLQHGDAAEDVLEFIKELWQHEMIDLVG